MIPARSNDHGIVATTDNLREIQLKHASQNSSIAKIHRFILGIFGGLNFPLSRVEPSHTMLTTDAVVEQVASFQSSRSLLSIHQSSPTHGPAPVLLSPSSMGRLSPAAGIHQSANCRKWLAKSMRLGSKKGIRSADTIIETPFPYALATQLRQNQTLHGRLSQIPISHPNPTEDQIRES